MLISVHHMWKKPTISGSRGNNCTGNVWNKEEMNPSALGQLIHSQSDIRVAVPEGQRLLFTAPEPAACQLSPPVSQTCLVFAVGLLEGNKSPSQGVLSESLLLRLDRHSWDWWSHVNWARKHCSTEMVWIGKQMSLAGKIWFQCSANDVTDAEPVGSYYSLD